MLAANVVPVDANDAGQNCARYSVHHAGIRYVLPLRPLMPAVTNLLKREGLRDVPEVNLVQCERGFAHCRAYDRAGSMAQR